MATQVRSRPSAKQHFSRLPRFGRQLGLKLWPALVIFGLVSTLWLGYVITSQPVILIINDQSRPIRTHYQTVEAVLQELDLKLVAEDIVTPGLQATLSAGETITIQLARPVTVEADGQTWQFFSHGLLVADILTPAGVRLKPGDEILLGGDKVSLETKLPASTNSNVAAEKLHLFAATTPAGLVTAGRPPRAELVVHRAVPVTLEDDQTGQTFRTTKPDVAEALREQGVEIYPGDIVTPGLDSQIRSGMTISIKRATPVVLLADGLVLKTRTQGQTVGEVLALEQIALMGQDFTRPPADHTVAPNDLIEIVRVRETLEIEEELLPFETQWVADDDLALDQQEIRQAGGTGVIKTRTRVRYENGQEVARVFEDEWLDHEPSNRVIAYGTNVVLRTLDTSDGPIEYWRKIPVLTTAYNAANSGKAPDHPRYGITRTGLPAGYGIVAVDPKVIPLRSKLYVPGYGQAIAGDTGGRVLGKHIDLGFDDDMPLPTIYEWRDVYLLPPVPNPDRIRYVLPQWPQR